MKCSNCGIEYENHFKFCMKCGLELEGQSSPNATIENIQGERVAAVAQPEVYNPPPYNVTNSPSVYEPSAPRILSDSINQINDKISQTTPRLKSYGQAQLSTLNIWGPFTGYGSKKHHMSWLMDEQGARAEELVTEVAAKFSVRQIPKAYITNETLTARGLLVESRQYFIITRGLVKVALYISEFGKDLFISLAAS
jgi:hypothetical protein